VDSALRAGKVAGAIRVLLLRVREGEGVGARRSARGGVEVDRVEDALDEAAVLEGDEDDLATQVAEDDLEHARHDGRRNGGAERGAGGHRGAEANSVERNSLVFIGWLGRSGVLLRIGLEHLLQGARGPSAGGLRHLQIVGVRIQTESVRCAIRLR
jgi:hypothetical protein